MVQWLVPSRLFIASIVISFLFLLQFPVAVVAKEAQAFFDASVVVFPSRVRMTDTHDFNSDGRLDAVGYYFPTSASYTVDAYQLGLQGWDPIFTMTFDGSRDLFGERDVLPLAAGDVSGSPGFVMATREDGVQFHRYPFDPANPWQSFPNPGIVDLDIADFNGDGLGDVVAMTQTSLVFYLSAGVSSAPTVATYPASTRNRICLSELNDDGSPDLVLYDDQQMDLCPVVGGVPEVGATYPTLGPGNLTSGDVDGDGGVDLVYFEISPTGDHRYQVLRRTGPASFDLWPVSFGGPAERLFDVDGDGDLDGLCCGGGGGGDTRNNDLSHFVVSLNFGLGNFAAGFQIRSLGANQLAGAADIDSDGDIDLVAGRTIYYGHSESYSRRHNVFGGAPLMPAMVVDLNQDGDLDLVDGGSLMDYSANPGNGRTIRRSLRIPDPPPAIEVRGHGYPGDWNGDGFTDLIYEHRQGNSLVGMRLYLNQGNGRFEDGGFAAAPGASLTVTGQNLKNTHFFSVDIDQDGDLDLFGRFNFNGAHPGVVNLNDGQGFFTRGQIFPEGHVVAAGDIDDDGNLDLVLRGFEFSVEYSRLHIRRGLGGGQFADAEFIANLEDRGRPTLFDVDYDGDLDLVAVLSTAPAYDLKFGLNDGSGQFNFVSAIDGLRVEGRNPHIYFADVNHDGVSDIVTDVAGGDEDCCYILVGSGTNAGYRLEAEQVVKPALLADFDGDGDLDVVSEVRQLIRGRRFDADNSGSWLQFGVGHPGTGGIVPILGASGPMRPGETPSLHLRAGLGGARAFLIANNRLTEVSRRGGTVYVVPGQLVEWTLDGPAVAGLGTYDLTFTAPAHLMGRTYYLQVGVLDSGASQNVSLTNPLELTFGE